MIYPENHDTPSGLARPFYAKLQSLHSFGVISAQDELFNLKGENMLHLGNRRVPPAQLKLPVKLWNK